MLTFLKSFKKIDRKTKPTFKDQKHSEVMKIRLNLDSK